ncbi:MAG: FAD-binding oxidoreductase [Actinomycetia bacterium]|nr:FAD-binding oxidoreductase [Actinomycetes bacterium]
MKVIPAEIGQEIRQIVGADRYRDDRRERRVYSSDIGVMPSLIQPFVKAGIAGGVARPANESELAQLLQLAWREHLAVVPRAGATSGYGGVLPRRGALVIDLNSLDQLLHVDLDALTVRCQAGAIWEKLDRQLAQHGLELAMHPSSYPSSSVAGWLAQGGNGFGSYEFGSFKDIVVAARVLGIDGIAQEFQGAELLDKIADAEGTTGIITEVTFRVRRREAAALRLVALPTAAALGQALLAIQAAKLPLWSLTFLNPAAIALKNYLPPAHHAHDYQLAEMAAEQQAAAALPREYLVMIVFPERRSPEVDAPLNEIIQEAGGHLLPAKAAEREWAGHTAPMRLKRLGPSIVPTEVMVPLASLADVLATIDQRVHQPFILEGMLAANGQVTLLGFIPHDERSLKFNLAFALALTVIRIAREHGGSAYSTGLYFRREAASILGAERLERLRNYKQQVDPFRLLNPGKVFPQPGGGRLLDTLMATASAMEPLIRPLANAAKVDLPNEEGSANSERQRIAAMAPQHGIPAETAYMAVACARCGYCVPTCEQFTAQGWESQSPRGKYAFLRAMMKGREKWDRKSIDTFLLCTTCERCDFRCQLQLPVEHSGMALRGVLINEEQRGTFPPFEMMAASLRGEGNIWAGKRAHRADWLPAEVRDRLSHGSDADVLYFAGCTASYVETDIAEATLRLLLDSGQKVAYLGDDEICCGMPMKMAGKWDLFSQIYEENTTAARQSGAKTIVTSCPACALVWKELYAEEAAHRQEPYEFQVLHYSQIIGPALAAGRIVLKTNPLADQIVCFHDSCHLGRAQGIYEEPRQMLAAIPGMHLVEMEHNREEGLCCGSVLTLVGDIEKAPILGKERLQEALDVQAQTVVALCPCCQVQLRDSVAKNQLNLTIDDLARVVAVAAGYDIPTTAAKTSYMWGMFDIFIRLMAPQQMAAFMQRIFPQMLAAMPLKMGPMMRGMAKLPFGPAMMRWMMPLMFPMMAPGILNKVMPDLIAEIEDYVGAMPPDMAALLPDLLPKTMNALMPTYIPQLVPHMVPSFIGFLRGEQPQAA